jgi:hypothetical protein
MEVIMKIKASTLLEAMQGGKDATFYTRRLKDGRTILCATPDYSEREFSAKQKEYQTRFKEAVTYARVAAKTQPIYAELAEEGMKTAYNIAISDWFHAPEILEVDTSAWKGKSGQVIRVKAVDDVLVMQVDVVITDGAGVTLEEGKATQVKDGWWSYTTTASTKDGAKVMATARDLPGHIAEFNWD